MADGTNSVLLEKISAWLQNNHCAWSNITEVIDILGNSSSHRCDLHPPASSQFNGVAFQSQPNLVLVHVYR